MSERFVRRIRGMLDQAGLDDIVNKVNALLNMQIVNGPPMLVGEKACLLNFQSTLGIHFDIKIEADPAAAIAYTRGTLAHISSTHVLVTTGYRLPPAPSGVVVKARPGWWISTQAVPAKATDNASGHEVYQVPQWPMPGADNDDVLRFWTYFGDISC